MPKLRIERDVLRSELTILLSKIEQAQQEIAKAAPELAKKLDVSVEYASKLREELEGVE